MNHHIVKINFLQERYWYVPSVFTTSKRKWLPRPYVNLKKLLLVENLWTENFILSLNKDPDFKIFRMIQSWKERTIFLNKNDLEMIESRGFVEEKIKHSNIFLRYDIKSIKAIKAGFLPYYKNFYLRSIQEKQDKKAEKYILLWRKNGFKEEVQELKIH